MDNSIKQRQLQGDSPQASPTYRTSHLNYRTSLYPNTQTNPAWAEARKQAYYERLARSSNNPPDEDSWN